MQLDPTAYFASLN